MATKLAVIADLHYYSPSLGVTGRAYELRSGSDQKCLAESGAVIDAAFDQLANSDVDAVLIAGDVTNDGEAVSHEGILSKIRKLQEKKPVYMITSTHDWCTDGNPRRYEGNEVFHDVPAYNAKTLDAAYADVGRNACIAEFENGHGFHSRVFQVSENLRLIAVNDDADHPTGASGYSKKHLKWMCEQIAAAKAAGCDVIAMEHHLLLYGVAKIINKGQSIGDNFAVAATLADAGLRLMFVGHSHMQRTTTYVSQKGNKITQVNVGALTGYPAPINIVTVENGKADVRVERLKTFTLNGKQVGASFFKEHTAALFYNLLQAAASDKQDLKDRLDGQGIHIGPYNLVYPFIRFFAKKALTIRVGAAARAVNFVTFGRGIDKKAVRAVRKQPLLPHIIDIIMNIFDGSETSKTQDENVKRIAMDVARLPGRIVRRLPMPKKKKEKLLKTLSEIVSIMKELLYPSLPDNTHSVVEIGK